MKPDLRPFDILKFIYEALDKKYNRKLILRWMRENIEDHHIKIYNLETAVRLSIIRNPCLIKKHE